MDFYFCNNIVRENFEGMMIKWNPSLPEWKIISVGYPYLSFNVDDMCFYLKFYDKTTDLLSFQYNLKSNSLQKEKNGFSIYHSPTETSYNFVIRN